MNCNFRPNNFNRIDTQLYGTLKKINAANEILSNQHIETLLQTNNPILDKDIHNIEVINNVFNNLNIGYKVYAADKNISSYKNSINIKTEHNKKISKLFNSTTLEYVKSLYGPISNTNIYITKSVEDLTLSEFLLLTIYSNNIDITNNDTPFLTVHHSGRISNNTDILYLHNGDYNLVDSLVRSNKLNVSAIAYKLGSDVIKQHHEIVDMDIVPIDNVAIKDYNNDIQNELKNTGYYIDNNRILVYSNNNDISKQHIISDIKLVNKLNTFRFKSMIYSLSSDFVDEDYLIVEELSKQIFNTIYNALSLSQKMIIHQLYATILLSNPSLNIFNYQRIVNTAYIHGVNNINNLYQILSLTSKYNDLSFIKDNNIRDILNEKIKSEEQNIAKLYNTTQNAPEDYLFYDSYNGYYVKSNPLYFSNIKNYNNQDNSTSILSNELLSKLTKIMTDSNHINDRLLSFLISMLERSNIKFEILNEQQFDAALSLFGRENNGEKIFYANGTIFINDSISNNTDILHELLHPFILVYYNNNQQDFSELINHIKQIPEYKEKYLDALGYYNNKAKAEMEILVLYLTDYLSDKLLVDENSKTLIEKILEKIINFVKDILGLPSKYDLRNNSKLSDILKFIEEENIDTELSKFNKDSFFANINYVVNSNSTKQLKDNIINYSRSLEVIKNSIDSLINKNVNIQLTNEAKNIISKFEKDSDQLISDVKSFISGKMIVKKSQQLSSALEDVYVNNNYLIRQINLIVELHQKQFSTLISLLNSGNTNQSLTKESAKILFDKAVYGIVLLDKMMQLTNLLYEENKELYDKWMNTPSNNSANRIIAFEPEMLEIPTSIVLLNKNISKQILSYQSFINKIIIENINDKKTRDDLSESINHLFTQYISYNKKLQIKTDELLVDYLVEYFYSAYNVLSIDIIRDINNKLASINKTNTKTIFDIINKDDGKNKLVKMVEDIHSYLKDIDTVSVSNETLNTLNEVSIILNELKNTTSFMDKKQLKRFMDKLNSIINAGYIFDKEIVKVLVLGAYGFNDDNLRAITSAVVNNNLVLSTLATSLNLSKRRNASKVLLETKRLEDVLSNLNNKLLNQNSNLDRFLTKEKHYILIKKKGNIEEKEDENYTFIVPQKNYNDRYNFLVNKRKNLINSIVELIPLASGTSSTSVLNQTKINELKQEIDKINNTLNNFYSYNTEEYNELKESLFDKIIKTNEVEIDHVSYPIVNDTVEIDGIKYHVNKEQIVDDVKALLEKFNHLTSEIRNLEIAVNNAINKNDDYQRELYTQYRDLLSQRMMLFNAEKQQPDYLVKRIFQQYFERINIAYNRTSYNYDSFIEDVIASLLVNDSYTRNKDITSLATLIDILSSKLRIYYKRDGGSGEVIHYTRIKDIYERIYQVYLKNGIPQSEIDYIRSLSELVISKLKEINSNNIFDDLYEDVFAGGNNHVPITISKNITLIEELNKLTKELSDKIYKIKTSLTDYQSIKDIESLLNELDIEKKIRPQTIKQLLEIIYKFDSNNLEYFNFVNNDTLNKLPFVTALLALPRAFDDNGSYTIPQENSEHYFKIHNTFYKFTIGQTNGRFTDVQIQYRENEVDSEWSKEVLLRYDNILHSNISHLTYITDPTLYEVKTPSPYSYISVKVSTFAEYSVPRSKEAYIFNTNFLGPLKYTKEIFDTLFEGFSLGNKYVNKDINLKYVTPHIIGLTVDNRGNYLPKIFNSKIFIEIANLLIIKLQEKEKLKDPKKQNQKILKMSMISKVEDAYLFLNTHPDLLTHNIFFDLIRSGYLDINKYLIKNGITKEYINEGFFELQKRDKNAFEDLLSLLSWWLDYQQRNLNTHAKLYTEIPRYSVTLEETRTPRDMIKKTWGLIMASLGLTSDDENWENVVSKNSESMYNYGLSSVPLFGNHRQNISTVSTSIASFIKYFGNVEKNKRLKESFSLPLSLSYVRKIDSFIPDNLNIENINLGKFNSLFEYKQRPFIDNAISSFILLNYRGRNYSLLNSVNNYKIFTNLVKIISRVGRFIAFYCVSIPHLVTVLLANYITQTITWLSISGARALHSEYSISNFSKNAFKLRATRRSLKIELVASGMSTQKLVDDTTLGLIFYLGLEDDLLTKILSRRLTISPYNILSLLKTPYKPKFIFELLTRLMEEATSIEEKIIPIEVYENGVIVTKKFSIKDLYQINKTTLQLENTLIHSDFVHKDRYALTYDDGGNIVFPPEILKVLAMVQSEIFRTTYSITNEYSSPFASNIIYKILAFLKSYLFPVINRYIGSSGYYKHTNIPNITLLDTQRSNMVIRMITSSIVIAYSLSYYLVTTIGLILKNMYYTAFKELGIISKSKTIQNKPRYTNLYNLGAVNFSNIITLSLNTLLIHLMGTLIYMFYGLIIPDDDEKEKLANSFDGIKLDPSSKLNYALSPENNTTEYKSAIAYSILAYNKLYNGLINSDFYKSFINDYGDKLSFFYSNVPYIQQNNKQELYSQNVELYRYFNAQGLDANKIFNEIINIAFSLMPTEKSGKQLDFDYELFNNKIRGLAMDIQSEMLNFSAGFDKDLLSKRYLAYAEDYNSEPIFNISDISDLKNQARRLSILTIENIYSQSGLSAHPLMNIDAYTKALTTFGSSFRYTALNMYEMAKGQLINDDKFLKGNMLIFKEKGEGTSEAVFKTILYGKFKLLPTSNNDISANFDKTMSGASFSLFNDDIESEK